jgi:hypothetical protein
MSAVNKSILIGDRDYREAKAVVEVARAIASGTVAGAPSELSQSALSQAKPLIDYRKGEGA